MGLSTLTKLIEVQEVPLHSEQETVRFCKRDFEPSAIEKDHDWYIGSQRMSKAEENGNLAQMCFWKYFRKWEHPI